jgi:phage tail sheath protein FI
MAQTYQSPGVYVEEMERGTRPIEARGTSTAGFMGITSEASRKAIDPATGERVVVESLLNKATLVTSWTQFVDYFGDFVPGAYLPDAVYGYFANGGGNCYVISLRALKEPAQEAKRSRKSKTAAEEPPADANPSPPAFLPLTVEEIIGDISDRTGLGGFENQDDISLLLCPDMMAGYDSSEAAKERIKAIQAAMIVNCERNRYRFAVLDTPPDLNAQQVAQWRKDGNIDTSYAAMYYPWIYVADLSGGESTRKLVPPSGHVAGIYNRSDNERGVHKAPANEVVQLALDLEIRLSRNEQDVLNPLGVNCIRSFPGRGIRLWGGRTLSSNPAWRYVNVRRLFIMVESSMDVGLQWVVFEPNDSNLWARVRRDITSFLRLVWLGGALFGATPEQAFYVKCDEELNPLEVRDLGKLIIEVGLAPVKPAEFVIFRISQWAGADAQA